MNSILIFFLFVACIFTSCHPTKNIQSVIPKLDTTSVSLSVPPDRAKNDSIAFIKSTYDKINSNMIRYNSFSAKVEVDYEDGEGKKADVNAHLRMYKDSVIWISITGPLGIEGLRIYIDRDSVRMLDKQNKIYTVRSIPFLQELTELPLDLHSLQELFIGNPVFLDPAIISYTRSDHGITLQSNSEAFKNLLTVSTKDYLPQNSKLDDVDPQRNRTCYLIYLNYENKKGVNFSTKRRIQVSEKKKLDIKLDFKQYEFNEKLSLLFNVPKNYERN